MRLPTRKITFSLTSTIVFCAGTYGAPALAWGGAGHTLISRAAALSLPTLLPNFVRTPEAVDEIAALGPELDRSKDAGRSHDADRDPGHYADIADDGTIAGIALTALPVTREGYDTALRAAGSNQYKMGFLPYSIVDGWQQVAKDFAIWRVDRVGEAKSTDPADRAWFAKDRELREILTLRDIGVWSHYVGDASQPLHVSIHYNGWGNYPNPSGFTESKETHANFEGAFVREHATLAAVEAHMRAPAPSSDPIAEQVAAYLTASASQVVPLYTIEKAGGFANGTPAAVDFVDARLADGAAELRDLIVAAWIDSASVKVGYPDAVTPAEAEGGTPFHRNQVSPSD
jgi:hypothetical protein